MSKLKNPHPGHILKYEFIDEIDISQNHVADSIYMPRNKIHAIVKGQRSITADTDLRLCKFFGVSEGYFLRLQNLYDTREAKRVIAKQVAKIQPYQYIQNTTSA